MKYGKLIIIIAICMFAIYMVVLFIFKQVFKSNKSTPISVLHSIVNGKDASPYVSIYSSDTDDVKKKKQIYNQLCSQWEKMKSDFEDKQKSGTVTDKDYEEYNEKGNEIADEIQKLGIKPESQETAAQKYEKEVDLYISDQKMVADGCLDQNGKVIPDLKSRYDNANKRIAYLKKVKVQYQKGEISAEEALKSFTEQNNIK